MLSSLGYREMSELIRDVVPANLLQGERDLALPAPLSETSALRRLQAMMGKNRVARSFIGRGYYDTITPPVIQRNVLENPGWYTAYTPYQPEISQGRLEALLNYQTLVCDLTGMPVSNASLLDEATAAAEAMAVAASARSKGRIFYVSDGCLDQTVDVLRTRAEPVGVEIRVGPAHEFDFAEAGEELLGVLLQYPEEDGEIVDHRATADACRAAGGVVVVAADLLALTLLTPPGEWGADVVVGSAQRFGVPLGYGGPHAAYMACSDKLKRRLPGRLVGVSRDTDGRPALRLALQTREQHIRREKATSNICTAQVLLAVMAGFYAVYHGPEGLRALATRLRSLTATFASTLKSAGFDVATDTHFDTVMVKVDAERRRSILEKCREVGADLRVDREDRLGVSFDEAALETGEWRKAFEVFGLDVPGEFDEPAELPEGLARQSAYLEQPVFHRYRTETEMMRYLHRLEERDIALNRSMIPLGSCTMKLNAAAEMLPLSWPEVSALHPFAPRERAEGYREMIEELEGWLAEITDFHAVSIQPNAGSQGEFAGLLAIRRYHRARGDDQRDVCLIPMSAHGTNPASAVMAGFRVVPVECDDEGNIDVDDISRKLEEHADRVAALMITYPSTHGVFEESVAKICELVHEKGGQVYMDGANLNAQVGLCTPGAIGADVAHLNLHKTFCIPHGGGGPGVGPIGVGEHLAEFLPGHGEWREEGEDSASADAPSYGVSAAPYGSASILTISWMYIAMMGPDLRRATELAILNANYVAHRLDSRFPILYRGRSGRVAHECIVDVRGFQEKAGVDVEDIAKRLIDFGFHAPTMSWPVPGTLMIEPTESESREELDRFCDAMIRIHDEIEAIASGEDDAEDNPMKRSPHPAEALLSDSWDRAYSRERGAYPADWVREQKYWPPIARIDNVYGDRHLVCTCEGMDAYRSDSSDDG